MLSERDDQREFLDAICKRFRAGEGVACRFFTMNNTYLFIGDHKYWLMTDFSDIDPYNDEGDYVINRARLYRDRRGFVIRAGDTGQARGLPGEPSLSELEEVCHARQRYSFGLSGFKLPRQH